MSALLPLPPLVSLLLLPHLSSSILPVLPSPSSIGSPVAQAGLELTVVQDDLELLTVARSFSESRPVPLGRFLSHPLVPTTTFQ